MSWLMNARFGGRTLIGFAEKWPVWGSPSNHVEKQKGMEAACMATEQQVQPFFKSLIMNVTAL